MDVPKIRRHFRILTMICPFPAMAEQAALQLPAGSQDRKTGLDGRVNERLGRSLHYSRAGDVCIGILVK